jgi:hypothetical protein
MLPKGGQQVWGNLTWAPDDQPGQEVSFGSLLKYAKDNSTVGLQNMTITEGLRFLLESSDDWYTNQVTRYYSHGVALSRQEIEVGSMKGNVFDPLLIEPGKREDTAKMGESLGITTPTCAGSDNILFLW